MANAPIYKDSAGSNVSAVGVFQVDENGEFAIDSGQPYDTPVTLLTAAAATGAWVIWPGGSVQWDVDGTWGVGTTARLEVSRDGVTGKAIDDSRATQAANGGFVLGPVARQYFRVVIANGSGASLTSTLSRA